MVGSIINGWWRKSNMQKSHRYCTVLFGPIGDAIMTAALFDDIFALDPEARFVVLARNNAGVMRDIMRAYAQVEVREIPPGLAAFSVFARMFAQRCNFLALGVAGKYSLRIKLFFALLALRPGNRVIGFNDRDSGQKNKLHIHQVFFFDPTMRTIDNFRKLLVPLFGQRAEALFGKPPHVALELQKPEGWSLAEGAYIAVHFFGSRVIRRLPPRRMVGLLKDLRRLYPNYMLVLTGSKDDKASAEELKRMVPEVELCIDAPLLEVGYVIEHAALYVGVDTGITHLAGVLQQKSIILSHSADPMWMPLYNPNARVLLNSTRCTCWTTGDCIVEEDDVQYRRCLVDISDELILSSIARALQSSERSVPNFAGKIDEKDNG